MWIPSSSLSLDKGHPLNPRRGSSGYSTSTRRLEITNMWKYYAMWCNIIQIMETVTFQSREIQDILISSFFVLFSFLLSQLIWSKLLNILNRHCNFYWT